MSVDCQKDRTVLFQDRFARQKNGFVQRALMCSSVEARRFKLAGFSLMPCRDRNRGAKRPIPAWRIISLAPVDSSHLQLRHFADQRLRSKL
jgi:hypothetical protein